MHESLPFTRHNAVAGMSILRNINGQHSKRMARLASAGVDGAGRGGMCSRSRCFKAKQWRQSDGEVQQHNINQPPAGEQAVNYLALVKYKDGNGAEFADWELHETYEDARYWTDSYGYGERNKSVQRSEIMKVGGCVEEQTAWNEAETRSAR